MPLEIPGISLRDVDASERAGDIGHFTGLVEVTLSVSEGTLTFAPNAPISMFISGDGHDDSTMSFRASTINANVALQMLIYRGNADSNGFDELIIAVNDLANSGYTSSRLCTEQISAKESNEEAEDDEAGCFDKDTAVAMNTGFGLRRNESLITRMVEIHGLDERPHAPFGGNIEGSALTSQVQSHVVTTSCLACTRLVITVHRTTKWKKLMVVLRKNSCSWTRI